VTAAPERTEPGARQDLVIEETGWSTYAPFEDTFLAYGIIIHNPNDAYAAEFYQLRITVRDTEGKVTGTETHYLGTIWPNETISWGTDWLSVSETVASVDFELLVDEYCWVDVAPDRAESITPLEVINQSENKKDWSLDITGEIVNNNSFDVESSIISAIFRDGDGKIIGGAMTYVDIAPKNGGTAPFQITVLYADIPYSTVELYAQMDSIQD
jgi:hypothetical protein